MPDIVLYRAHRPSPAVDRELARLRRELPGTEVRVVAFLPDGAPPFPGAHVVSAADIAALPYGRKSAGFQAQRTAGNNDLPVLHFFRAHPGYDRYWVVEYDVRWTGPWPALFDALGASPADLLATAVATEAEVPGWTWWRTLGLHGRLLPPDQRLKAFLPFCRLSRRALQALDAACAAGAEGHYEALWPSFCRRAGLGVEDIGGRGRWTPPERQGRFYSSTPTAPDLSPGTFVFRPAYRDAEVEALGRAGARPMLWHPVKDAPAP